ncbi:MAG: porin [Phycisphaerales bacterium]|nr:porin [Phycisphaerales bacterium]
MPALIVEFVGTFFLAFAVCIAVGGGVAHGLAPFAIFAILAAMIYAGGHISGAAYNPAVSIGLWLRKRLTGPQCVAYIAVQLAAAAAAALLADSIPSLQLPAPMGEFAMTPAVIVEFLFTMALVWTVLQVATNPKTAGNSYFGVAIAAVVMSGALLVGTVSSAVFNPAVATAVHILHALDTQTYAWYLGAQCLAGVAGYWLFKVTAEGK